MCAHLEIRTPQNMFAQFVFCLIIRAPKNLPKSHKFTESLLKSSKQRLLLRSYLAMTFWLRPSLLFMVSKAEIFEKTQVLRDANGWCPWKVALQAGWPVKHGVVIDAFLDPILKPSSCQKLWPLLWKRNAVQDTTNFKVYQT